VSQRILLRPTEAAEVLGLSRSTVYRLLKDGVLPSVSLGRRGVRVPVDRLYEWVKGLAVETRASASEHPCVPEGVGDARSQEDNP